MILFKKNAAGILLLIAAAALGAALIYLPGWILDRYARISEWSPTAGKIYLATVALGAILLLGSMLYGWWKLWRFADKEAAPRTAQPQSKRVIAGTKVG